MSGKTNGWPGTLEKPIGDDPEQWSDGMHELDGLALGSTLTPRDGEAALHHEMSALMVIMEFNTPRTMFRVLCLIRHRCDKRVTWR